jgi:hypothetical protein
LPCLLPILSLFAAEDAMPKRFLPRRLHGFGSLQRNSSANPFLVNARFDTLKSMEISHLDNLTPIALVTTAALLCGLLLIRLRQPAVVGYIVAGIVLGPTGFKLV